MNIQTIRLTTFLPMEGRINLGDRVVGVVVKPAFSDPCTRLFLVYAIGPAAALLSGNLLWNRSPLWFATEEESTVTMTPISSTTFSTPQSFSTVVADYHKCVIVVIIRWT